MENIVSFYRLAVCKINTYYYWVVINSATEEVVKKSKHGCDSYKQALNSLEYAFVEITLDYPNIDTTLIDFTIKADEENSKSEHYREN